MLRPRSIPTLVLSLLLVAGARPAAAETEITLYGSGVAGQQAQEVAIDVPGSESYQGTGGVTLYGADVGLGFPKGFYVDAHYFRHSNEFVSELAGSAYDARIDLAGDEWGASLEWQLDLMPSSAITPFVGAGGSWSRLTLDGKIDLRGDSAPVTTEVDLYRAYGVAGLKLNRFLRLTAQGGWTFGGRGSDATSYDLGGQAISVATDYDGYFVAGALSLGL